MARLTESRLIDIGREGDTHVARIIARSFAEEIGLDAIATVEIATAVSELASNTLFHGGGGQVILRFLPGYFEVFCLDRGPGFAATSERPPHGLGIGLEGAHRLMGQLETGERAGGGSFVRARRALPVASAASGPRLAVARRFARGEVVSGDVVFCHEHAHGLTAGVIDGLGHGEGAREAALRVERAMKATTRLKERLAAAHEAARPTRGAVIALLDVDLREGLLHASGIGNVRLLDLDAKRDIAVVPGCLGVRWEDPIEYTPDGRRFAFFSDGVGNEGYGVTFRGAPLFFAEEVILKSKGDDDATVAVLDTRPLFT